MIDRNQIIERNPLVPYLESKGIVLTRGTTNRCPWLEHRKGHLCVSVSESENLWKCHDCDKGGCVIDWEMHANGISAVEAMTRLGGETMPDPIKTNPAPSSRAQSRGSKLVKTYDYTDEAGGLLYQVCRFEPKDFRQRVPDGNGGYVWKLDGIRRVLYNLPKIIDADMVWICEGEKDADTMNAFMGITATTNVGGAKKWDPSYSAALRGKDVVLLPDNDKAGGEHRDALKIALAPIVKSMRIVEMPEGFKDVSELVGSFPTPKDGMAAILDIADKAQILYRGESVPIQTMAELEDEYRQFVRTAATHSLSLNQWLPSIGARVRPLVPGELVTILAGTGCGKTMILQNIALNTNLATLLFEAELPGTLSFERFAAMATKTSGSHVEAQYRMSDGVDWRKPGTLNHVVCCHESRLTPDRIGRIIESAELKTGIRPVLILVDYIQLVGGDGSSRYERTSCVAEQLKTVAKETKTIILVASQVGRPSSKADPNETREVSLTDGKDSGSIENSSGLVLGAWRDGDDDDRLWIRILKNTKGKAGGTIPCRINESLLIREEKPDA